MNAVILPTCKPGTVGTLYEAFVIDFDGNNVEAGIYLDVPS